MNTKFVSSYFYDPHSPARQAAVPKWSPSDRALHLITTAIALLCNPKLSSRVWSMGGNIDGRRIAPTNIVHLIVPALKIRLAIWRMFNFMDTTTVIKRRALTINEVHEAFGPISEKYPPILSLQQAA
jgi:hypothetical protein